MLPLNLQWRSMTAELTQLKHQNESFNQRCILMAEEIQRLHSILKRTCSDLQNEKKKNEALNTELREQQDVNKALAEVLKQEQSLFHHEQRRLSLKLQEYVNMNFLPTPPSSPNKFEEAELNDDTAQVAVDQTAKPQQLLEMPLAYLSGQEMLAAFAHHPPQTGSTEDDLDSEASFFTQRWVPTDLMF